VIKYALNLSPTQSSLLDLGLVKNGATVTLQFPAPAHPDVDYTVKASDTLGSWTQIAHRAPYSREWSGTATVNSIFTGTYQ
jgi:hypothetical protein